MEEVVFRGKTKSGKWVEGWLLGNLNSSGGVFIVTYYQYALNQKTGDKFNLGDNRIIYTVVWQDSGLRGRQGGNQSIVGLDYWQERIEIIGNVHEEAQNGTK